MARRLTRRSRGSRRSRRTSRQARRTSRQVRRVSRRRNVRGGSAFTATRDKQIDQLAREIQSGLQKNRTIKSILKDWNRLYISSNSGDHFEKRPNIHGDAWVINPDDFDDVEKQMKQVRDIKHSTKSIKDILYTYMTSAAARYTGEEARRV